MEKIIKLEKYIMPSLIKFNKKLYKILEVKEPSLIIKEYKIILNDDKLESLMLLNSIHPNCNPEDNKFCLPSYLLGKKFNEVRDSIEYLLSVYWIDNSYFGPWRLVKYEKITEV